ncbi:zinc-binding dehydrogenase [Leucobacter insecticola]|uniref:Zinc-binding dehydrogenase n=1 Tax=Leucobacter insecticola TaxID=2714934 RepID=A0A6G8FJ46_9MICO|nr:zinc-binding dehydrogenase [Leucobacter insecticola]QIM16486.1 zinc-binding dehydrogenase [Leucobacter insecticola]
MLTLGTCLRLVCGRESNNCTEALAGRGYGADGGIADYVLVTNTRDILRLNGLDPVTAAPMTDAGATAFHGVNRVRGLLGADSTAFVFGTGGLGSFAIQFLRVLTPARIVAVDMLTERRKLALQLGAHEAIAGVDEHTLGVIRDMTAGRGADAILDFVGLDATINTGVAGVRPGGAYGVIGAAGGSLTANSIRAVFVCVRS